MCAAQRGGGQRRGEEGLQAAGPALNVLRGREGSAYSIGEIKKYGEKEMDRPAADVASAAAGAAYSAHPFLAASARSHKARRGAGATRLVPHGGATRLLPHGGP